MKVRGTPPRKSKDAKVLNVRAIAIIHNQTLARPSDNEPPIERRRRSALFASIHDIIVAAFEVVEVVVRFQIA